MWPVHNGWPEKDEHVCFLSVKLHHCSMCDIPNLHFSQFAQGRHASQGLVLSGAHMRNARGRLTFLSQVFHRDSDVPDCK